MKLTTFFLKKEKHIGLLINDYVVDFDLAAKRMRIPSFPRDMKEFLEMGSVAMNNARVVHEKAFELLSQGKQSNYLFPVKSVKLWAPVDKPEKIICIGQNYIDHCREQGVEPPERPIVFAKFWNTLNGPSEPVLLPGVSDKIDYEAELAFVIGKRGRNISIDQAMKYVAGYMVLNDITARDIQKSDGQWVRGKSCDTFAPCGPSLVTKDEIKDPHLLKISLKLNGKVMQESSTSNLIFKIPFLIEYLSKSMTLQPGDIVSTGTPPGVGFARKPPVFLKAGDVIETFIENIGCLKNKIK